MTAVKGAIQDLETAIKTKSGIVDATNRITFLAEESKINQESLGSGKLFSVFYRIYEANPNAL